MQKSLQEGDVDSCFPITQPHTYPIWFGANIFVVFQGLHLQACSVLILFLFYFVYSICEYNSNSILIVFSCMPLL
jgi:hypothetical protein